MSATIKYKGNTIATASNNTKTLLTAGKYMEANVVVTDNGGGGGASLYTESVSYTPSESAIAATLTPSAGYDGFDQVNIAISAIPSSYVGSGIPQMSSANLSASGATVTAPSGYYASSASKTIAAGSAYTPTTSISAVPTISIVGNTVTASVSKSQSITPTVSAGYVSAGTAGTVTVSGSGSATIPNASAPYGRISSIDSSGNVTMDFEIDYGGYIADGTYTVTDTISVQGAQTITPGTSNQTIASGQYLTGAQTILGDADLVAGNIKKDVTIFNVTGTYDGGGDSNPTASFNYCNFIDYDGTIRYSYSYQDTRTLAALPPNPTHTGLVSKGWNWTLSEITNEASYGEHNPIIVGQFYETTSGNTEIDIEVTDAYVDAPPLERFLTFGVKGSGTIDWGDGTTTSITGTNHETKQNKSHTYTTNGKYTISLIPSTNDDIVALIGASGTPSYNANVTSTNLAYQYRTCRYVDAVRLGKASLCRMNNYGAAYYYNARYFTVNQSEATGRNTVANSNFNMLTVPRRASLATNYCENASALRYIALSPYSSGHSGINTFASCNGLRFAPLYEGVTAIPQACFSGCSSMRSVFIPSSVTSIAANAFQNCNSLALLHMTSTIPPTLANTNALSGTNSTLKIYVPRSTGQTVLTAYQTANNWSTYASKMEEEPL